MKNIIARGRTTAAKAAAAYATYQTAVKVTKVVADKLTHHWSISPDYLPGLYAAGNRVAIEHAVASPLARRKVENEFGAVPIEGMDEDYEILEWSWVPVAGVSRFLQVRATPGEYDTPIEFRAPRMVDLDKLRLHLLEVEAEMEATRPAPKFNPQQVRQNLRVASWNGKDEWDYSQARPARTFDSVVLPVELQRDIEDDLVRFTESRERLQRLEMPWRRGYMLYGPPGTGKTSLSLAIAGSLGFNVASLSLTDIKSDGKLRKAVGSLGRNTVLVIEDIDAYSVSNDREHNAARDGDLSLSGLLNSLDGFETPEGLVTILTSNHIDHLDNALIRAGRIDRAFCLDFIQPREVERLFMWFYEQEPPTDAPMGFLEQSVKPADVNEAFKQHLEDPEAGWKAVLELVNAPALSLVKEIAA